VIQRKDDDVVVLLDGRVRKSEVVDEGSSGPKANCCRRSTCEVETERERSKLGLRMAPRWSAMEWEWEWEWTERLLLVRRR